jgi:hypothetical protein
VNTETSVKITDVIADHISGMLPEGLSLDFEHDENWRQWGFWTTGPKRSKTPAQRKCSPTHIYTIRGRVPVMRVVYTEANIFAIPAKMYPGGLSIQHDTYLNPTDPNFISKLGKYIMEALKSTNEYRDWIRWGGRASKRG